ncbi:MAG: hypothetical protein ACI4GW_11700 [Lachnospiraceae bacterium]
MSRKKITFIIVLAFLIGVFATLIVYFIFQKHAITEETNFRGTDYMGTVVLDGYKIPIPNRYMAAVDKEVGLSYCDKETFEMSIMVVDGSYELTLQNLESLNADIGECFRVLKPFDEFAIDRRSYIYCTYEDEGDTILLAYHRADEEHVFEIMVRCLAIDNMHFQSDAELKRAYESYILIADSLLCATEPSDEDDTPSGTVYVADEMYSDMQVVLPKNFEPKDTLLNEDERQIVSYQIEEGFYRIADSIRPGNYSMKIYSDLNRDIQVTVTATAYAPDETDIQAMMEEGSKIWTDSLAKVNSKEINEKTFYYYSYSEDYEVMDTTHKIYHFEASTDIGNGIVYRISAKSDASEDVLDINNFIKFMKIEIP